MLCLFNFKFHYPKMSQVTKWCDISLVNLIQYMNLSQQTLLGTYYLEKAIANLLFHKLLFSDQTYSVTVLFALDLSKWFSEIWITRKIRRSFSCLSQPLLYRELKGQSHIPRKGQGNAAKWQPRLFIHSNIDWVPLHGSHYVSTLPMFKKFTS